MEFQRQRKGMRELPLTPLIDVVFILIVFFMLTTSFMKIQSLELMLPSAAPAPLSGENAQVSRIFIHDDGAIAFGERRIEMNELREVLGRVFAGKSGQRVVVYSSPNVSLQRLVDVMDMVQMSGGQSLFVQEWKQPAPVAQSAGVAAGAGL